jgi:hypothetical protein
MEIGLWLSEPEHWRDLFIMMFTVAGTVAFLMFIVFTFLIGMLSLGIVLRLRRIVKNNLQPAFSNVRDTTETVRGTVTFISDNAVKPVAKAYGTAAGARRFVSVLVRLTRPRKAE